MAGPQRYNPQDMTKTTTPPAITLPLTAPERADLRRLLDNILDCHQRGTFPVLERLRALL